MFDSLANQYLIQTPDYHPITIKADCLSGSVSGIAPVLELGHRVFVGNFIISKALAKVNLQTLMEDEHSSPANLSGLTGVPCSKKDGY